MAGITPPIIGPVSRAVRPSAKTARAFVDDAGSGSMGCRVGTAAGTLTYPIKAEEGGRAARATALS
ncbi:hypothetical protein Acsp02_35440 [Actinoplanes sp. NBRC 103695]|nr:hypothetical protein Acsp02_35440 [Actinoplanes sp. NBRC 103695]